MRGLRHPMGAQGRLFGTDGVRGRWPTRDLTAELALDLAVAAAHVLGDAGEFEGHRPVAVVGRDPRASGEFLEAAVVAGLASAGVRRARRRRACRPRRSPTSPADLGADLGVMLSASHNPMPDNGIKFFAPRRAQAGRRHRGRDRGRMLEPWQRPAGRPRPVGRVARPARGVGRVRRPPARRRCPTALDGLQVVVDCANGAASAPRPRPTAPGRRRGRRAIDAEPDGLNINDGCGSTHLGPLAAAVRRARGRRRHRPRRRRRPLPGRRRRRRRGRRRPDPRGAAPSRCATRARWPATPSSAP